MAYPYCISSEFTISLSSFVSSTMCSSCLVGVAHSCDGCGGRSGRRYEPADTIDVGFIHLHGGSSGSNGGGSPLTWWEKKGQLSGHRDRVMVAKKCHAFKAERHRDENKVTILGACIVQVPSQWQRSVHDAGRCNRRLS